MPEGAGDADADTEMHLFSFGTKNFLVELWADTSMENTILVRLTQSTATSCLCLSSHTLNLKIPTGKWNHLAVTCRQRSLSNQQVCLFNPGNRKLIEKTDYQKWSSSDQRVFSVSIRSWCIIIESTDELFEWIGCRLWRWTWSSTDCSPPACSWKCLTRKSNGWAAPIRSYSLESQVPVLNHRGITFHLLLLFVLLIIIYYMPFILTPERISQVSYIFLSLPRKRNGFC